MKQQTKKSIIALFLVFLMIFSIAGIIGGSIFTDSSQPQNIEYNGYSFTPSQQGYITTVNNQKITFSVLPSEVEGLSNTSISLQGEKLYYVTESLTNVTIGSGLNRLRGISQLLGIRSIAACMSESCTENIPLISCPNENLVFIFEPGPSSITQIDDTCFVLQAEDEFEFYKIIEYITYQTFNILQ